MRYFLEQGFVKADGLYHKEEDTLETILNN
jgi:hypothetical protein